MPRVIGIVPSHNEERNIEACIEGLQAQTFPIDILVVCDNCNDQTEEIAQSMGVMTTKTIGNTGMRAGAVNWGLDMVMENNYDYVLVSDADTTFDPGLIEVGSKALDQDETLGAVCSRAGVKPQPELKNLSEKLLWQFQHIEYGEYDSSRIETTGKIKTAHGMATLFRMEVFTEQYQDKGYVYNNSALCEDYWLTMDLKLLGWRVSSCQEMNAWTIVPTKLGWLWKQRTRWLLGGIDSIVAHGINWVTFWDIMAHFTSMSIMVINIALTILIAYLAVHGNNVVINPLFYLVYAAVWLDGMYRLRYVQRITIWDIILKGLLIPYALYSMLHMGVQLNAYRKYIQGARRSY
jgi:biofilm PGA synthesis N-glycosyltransferase PgaC